ncbi:MAG: aminotransferase class III-fold pyridoxal phosphate-dependent enzyme, partial [Steroidobacteraceae bacterium]|nr:aminotransferase class III-fold pyridoxal phosphate-dependent enzyme [Steroidobacteraceae bacterium]MDW8258194.1 aminotransferase class III-fold pyridoxal phosphate-dependent enzyme [Gammaproteobacteria bacterium]
MSEAGGAERPADNRQWHERRCAAVPRGVSNSLSIYAERARNAELWDVEARRYLDFAAGIAVLNTGHLHPRVVAAVEAQLGRLSHACFQVTPYPVYVQLAERLNALAPGPAPKKTIFLTTGAEAVENAIKIARYATRRSAVIAFAGGFHGRTLAALTLTGKVQPYKAGFGPMLPEVFHAPFPIAYHGIRTEAALDALESLFKTDVDPARVAALIVEPVQGEGGFYVAPNEFLRALRALCDRHGMLLIVDEIQTGFARTGRMFAMEHAGIEPDLITVAKSIAGGLPLAAVIGKAEIMDAPPPGGL